MRRLAILLLLGVGAASGQKHPRMTLTPELLGSLRERARANDAAWVALRGKIGGSLFPCEHLVQPVSTTPDNLPRVYASREPLSDRTPALVNSGYQGSNYYEALHNLAVCYQVMREMNPEQAGRYAAQGVKILRAMSAPFATVTNTQTGFQRVAWYVDNTGPGGQAQVFMNWPTPELTAGTAVRVGGALGCTAANGAHRVGRVTGNSFLLDRTDGSPVICEGRGTNYNHNFLSDGGYPIRFFLGTLAVGYDWLFDALDDVTKQQIYRTMNAWIREFKLLYAKNGDNPYRTRTQSNYHVGYYAAVGLVGIATRGENPEGEAHYQEWRSEIHLGRDQPFFQRWLGSSAGFPEAWRYLQLSVTNLAMPVLANYTAFGDDLVNHPTQPFPWITELMRYYVHGTTPTLTNFNDRGFVGEPASASYDTNRTTPGAFWVPYYVGKVLEDPFTPKFKQFIEDVLARYNTLRGDPSVAAGLGPLWLRFVFFDLRDPSADWKTEPLSLATMSNPAGGHGQIFMRSSWDQDAVFATFYVSPQTSDAYNGKERMDKGSLAVQRNNVFLLVNPPGEASRSQDMKAYTFFHDGDGIRTIPRPRELNYSLFYVTRPGWTSYQWPAVSRLQIVSPGSDETPPDAPNSRQNVIAQVDPQAGTFLAPAHGAANGDLVYFTSTGTLPAPLKNGDVYYIREASAGSFRVSAEKSTEDCSSGPACMDLTDAGQGTLTVWSSAGGRIVTAHPTRVDRYEEGGWYTYSRGTGLESLFACDEELRSHFPVGLWERELLYIRPSIFVVYDKTQKRNGPGLEYTQYLAWSLGKKPELSLPPQPGMLRVDVADGDVYKGALVGVLPENSTAEIVDLGGHGVVYQVRVSPPEERESWQWLTVVDAAGSSADVTGVMRLESSNIDAIALKGEIAAGFVRGPAPEYPIRYAFDPARVQTHVLAGFPPNTTLRVQLDREQGWIQITDSGAEGEEQTTSAAGLLRIGREPVTQRHRRPRAGEVANSATASSRSR